MTRADARCVLLADSHHGLSEGLRTMLATTFETVVMVADQGSLFETARRLHSDLAVVDLALPRGSKMESGLDMVRQLRDRFPRMKLIIVSNHDQSSVSRAVLEAGADGFVAKRAIATCLLEAADAVLGGHQFVSPTVGE